MSIRLLHIQLLREKLAWNPQLLLRILVIGLVLLGSAYLPFISSLRYLYLILGASGCLIILKWPPLGLAVLIFASMVIPFEIQTGSRTGINITILWSAVLVGCWLLRMLVHERRITMISSKTVAPLILFVAVSFLSFGMGQLDWFSFTQPAPLTAQFGGLAVFVLSAAAFLLVANQIQDIRWLQGLTYLFLALGTLYIGGRLLLEVGGFILPIFQYGATGSVFWIWLVSLSFSQAIFNRCLHRVWRLAFGGLVLATFYVGLFQTRSWASGWLPPIVALVTILWIGSPRLGRLVVMVGGVVVLANVQKVVDLIMINEQYSWITRLEAWRIITEIVKVSPALGLGPANYYWYAPLFPILGWHVRFSSHNQFVDIMAQTGLLGLACFLWFVWELGKMGWRLRAYVSEGFEQSYTYGALGALVGMLTAGMLADWVLPFVYNITLSGMRASVLGWLFLGGLVSLEQIAARRT